MKRSLAAIRVLCALTLLMATLVHAQEAPAPRKMPRTPVQRSLLTGKSAEPADRLVEGPLTIIDNERLRIGDTDMRLFGVVPPQLSASFGPQARSALDAITSGKSISCQIRDRDHDGRYLATCKAPNGDDLALQLLQRGLAVTARGSLAGTELLITYIAGEQAAQSQKVGLWSVIVPAAVAVPDSAKAEVAKTEAAKTETPKVEPAAPAPAKPEVHDDKSTTKLVGDDAHAIKSVPAVAMPPTTPLTLQTPLNAHAYDGNSDSGFIVHYQILITGLLILGTALSILMVLSYNRRAERREELRAIAAALRGELMAARVVCQTRLRGIMTDEDDIAMTWPRIRSTLYQAYVGRIGALGAELARKVASIYGQSSDYAAYYNSDDSERATLTPKRQGLETLIHHIEAVLPKLAAMEETGRVALARAPVPPTQRPVNRRQPSPPRAPHIEHLVADTAVHTAHSDMAPHEETQPPLYDAPTSSSVSSLSKEPVDEAVQAVNRLTAPLSDTSTLANKAAPAVITPAPKDVLAESVVTESSMRTSRESKPGISPIPLWKAMRNFTRERMANRHESAVEQPDYNAMLEEEMASMSFTDSEELVDPSTDTSANFRGR